MALTRVIRRFCYSLAEIVLGIVYGDGMYQQDSLIWTNLAVVVESI